MARRRGGGTFYMRVDDRLPQTLQKGLDAADKAAVEACEKGAQVTRAESPRRTGALVGSVKVGRAKRGQATIAIGVPYAAFQEFGTRRGVKGHHMLRRGITAAQKAWPGLAKRRIV